MVQASNHCVNLYISLSVGIMLLQRGLTADTEHTCDISIRFTHVVFLKFKLLRREIKRKSGFKRSKALS